MLTHRYIQAVLTGNVADTNQHTTTNMVEINERATSASQQRGHDRPTTFRLVDLDRRFGI